MFLESSDPRLKALHVELCKKHLKHVLLTTPRATQPPKWKVHFRKFCVFTIFTFPDHLVLRIEGGLGHSCLDEVCAWCVPGGRLQATVRTHRVPAALYRWDVNQQRMPHEPTDILLLLTSFFTFQFPPQPVCAPCLIFNSEALSV